MGLYSKPGSKKWWMSFTYKGKQYHRSTGTEDEDRAALVLSDVKLKIFKEEQLGVEVKIEYTFDEMMEKFMDEYAPQQSNSMQRRYRQILQHLQFFFGGMLLTEIDPKLVNKYMHSRLKELSCRKTLTKPATVNREFSMLARAFKLAVSKKWQMAKVNPCSVEYVGEQMKFKENNERERYLINDEEKNLLKAAERYLHGQLWEIIVVALYMGMRQGEILKLRHAHVDLEGKKLIVIKENSKTKVSRTIPIISETVLEIFRRRMDKKIISISQPQNSLVFTTKNGKRISARNLQRAFAIVCQKAGIEDFVFHDLRHTFGTWLAQNGVDIYTIARYMGHEDLQSTKRYTHHDSESLRASVGTIEKMTGKLKMVIANND